MTIISHLKREVSKGNLKKEDFKSQVGQPRNELNMKRINSMIKAKAEEKLDISIKSLKSFRQLFDEYSETIIYRH